MKSQWFHPFTQRSILTERVKIDVSPRGALMVLAGFHKGLIDMLVKIVVVKRGILLAGSIRTTFFGLRTVVCSGRAGAFHALPNSGAFGINSDTIVCPLLSFATHTSHCNVLD